MLALIRRTSAVAGSPLACSRSRGAALSPSILAVFLSLVFVWIHGSTRAVGAECGWSQCNAGPLATVPHADSGGAHRRAMIDAWLPLGLAEVLVVAPPLENFNIIEARDGRSATPLGDLGPDRAGRVVTLDEQPADGAPVHEDASASLYGRLRAFIAAACEAARLAGSNAAVTQPNEVGMPEFSWTERLKVFVREARFRARLGVGGRDGASRAFARSDL
jgi:hypothetical protein